jgi:hypothetical protein
MGSKVSFIQFTIHKVSQKMCTTIGLDIKKDQLTRNKFWFNPTTNGPTEINFGLSKQHWLAGKILDSTQQQMDQICFMTKQFVTIRMPCILKKKHATSDATSDSVQRDKATGTKL